MDYKVVHRPERGRFEVELDGHTGYVEYIDSPGGIHLTHTIVPQQIEGRGVAAALVKAAFDHAREKGLKVTTSCSYVMLWMRRHPDECEF